MADYNSSLPVRTEAAGDVIVKLGDGTTPGQQLAIDASGFASVKTSSNGSAAGGTAGTTSLLSGAIYNSSAPTLTTGQQASLQLDVSGNLKTLASLAGSKTPADAFANPTDGIDTLSFLMGWNGTTWDRLKSTTANGLVVDVSRVQGTVSVTGPLTDAQLRATAVPVSGTVTANIGTTNGLALDTSVNSLLKPASTLAAVTTVTTVSTVTAVTAITNALPAGANVLGKVGVQVAGADVSATNPVPVTISDAQPGTSIQAYNTAASLAANATSNHDYTVTAAKTLSFSRVWASASGKLKIEVQYETGVATGVFNTKFVGFNSTANPNIDIDITSNSPIAAGVRVRIIRTNKDNSAQDVFSTVEGSEI